MNLRSVLGTLKVLKYSIREEISVRYMMRVEIEKYFVEMPMCVVEISED